ncbi:MAG: ATP-binding protein [Acidimicrobiia bacterium]
MSSDTGDAQAPVRVLVIDDDDDDFFLIDDTLAQSPGFRFELDWAATYEEGLAAIRREEHDAYLVDYRLGSGDGLELLQEARARGCTRPIIILTGQGNRSVDVEAMQYGAADYLVKDRVSAEGLERCIRYSLERAQARERLENLARSKDQLIASVAHELRTPLAAVIGFAQVLKDESGSLSEAERAEMIQLIVAEGMDLSNVVDDLLVAARAESPLLAVAQVSVDLRAQAAQVLESLGREGVGRLECLGPTARALGDPSRVRQILRNLVSNALKYGGDEIRVVVTGSGSTARVAVIDNGHGVPPGEEERIFESYERAHSLPGLAPSLGLGLTVSRELARLMGGDLTYRREADESIFELALPKAH